MACGTPVIARRRGSMPEIVRDGENGFLVDTLDEAVAAVARVEGARPGGRARVGGRALRRRADGGRLPRPLSARRRTPPRRRSSRASAELEIAAEPVPGRRQLLAGAHRDGLVVEVRSWRRLKPTLRGSPPAVSTPCGCSSPGRTSSRPRTGSTARCSSGSSRLPISPASWGSRSFPPSSPVT